MTHQHSAPFSIYKKMGNFFSTKLTNLAIDLSDESHHFLLNYFGNVLRGMNDEYLTQQVQYQKGMLDYKPLYVDLFQISLPTEMVIRFETSLTKDLITSESERKGNATIVVFRNIASLLNHFEVADKIGRRLIELKFFIQNNRKLFTPNSKTSPAINQRASSNITKELNYFDDTIREIAESTNHAANLIYNRLQINNFLTQIDVYLSSNFQKAPIRKVQTRSRRYSEFVRMDSSVSITGKISPENDNPFDRVRSRSRSLSVSKRESTKVVEEEELDDGRRSVSPMAPSDTREPEPVVEEKKKKKPGKDFHYSFLKVQKGYTADPRFLKMVKAHGLGSSHKSVEKPKADIPTKTNDSSEEEEVIAVTLPKNRKYL